MLIERDAGMRGADQPRQLGLALLDRPAAQILTIQLDQVEGAQPGLRKQGR